METTLAGHAEARSQAHGSLGHDIKDLMAWMERDCV